MGNDRDRVPAERGERGTWRETFVALGESLIEVLRAELAVIVEAWQGSLRHLAIALGIFAVAGYVALVCLPALLIFAMVVGLNAGLGWPLWASALAVAGLVAVVVGVLAWLAARRLSKHFESPVATVKDRVADHTAWWNDRLLGERERASGATGLEDNGKAGATDEADEEPRQTEPGDRSPGE